MDGFNLLRLKNALFVFSYFLIFSSFAQNTGLESFYLKFKTGDYQAALQELELVRASTEFNPTRNYLMALTYKNMQKHDLAIAHFKMAIKLGKTSEDLFFEYGQSLFAVNELEKAKRAFRISFQKGYKTDFSLYYIAHISELLEDHSAVKSNYIQLIKDKKSDKGMRQIAYLRLAEVIYNQIKNKFYAHNYIAKYVVPLLDKGLAIDPKSDTASEIESRYDEILLKHNMHPLLLDNGRMLSRQATTLIFTQQYQQDDNVTLESDAPGLTSTNTDASSAIMNSELFYSKRFVGGKYFVLTPEMRLSYSSYLNDTNPDIYQNDSYGISPALRGSYNFSWNKKRAELLYEIEYNYTARDKNQEKKRTFFGRSTTYSLGLRKKFFDNGDTTFKVRQRTLSSFNNALSGSTTTLYLDQLFVRENGHIIVGLFISDFYRPESEVNATDSFLFRADYLIPRLVWGIDFNLSASLTMLDTKLQKSQRGVEKNTTYGLKIQKRFNKKWRLGVTYNRTQNDSSDVENFSYIKSVTGLELRYTW